MKNLRNKYSVWYFRLVQKALHRPMPTGYVERHHYVPTCLGGTNEQTVWLTAREHYVAHLLLARMFPKNSPAWKKMIGTLMRFGRAGNGTIIVRSSRLYAVLRRRWAQINSERPVSAKTRAKYSKVYKEVWSDPEYKAKMKLKRTEQATTEVREKIAGSVKALWEDPVYRERMSAAHRGKKRSPEALAKFSVSMRKVWAERKAALAC